MKVDSTTFWYGCRPHFSFFFFLFVLHNVWVMCAKGSCAESECDGLNNGENLGSDTKKSWSWSRSVPQPNRATKKNCNRNINEQHLSPARTGSSFYYRGPITFFAKRGFSSYMLFLWFITILDETGERNFFFLILIFKIYVFKKKKVSKHFKANYIILYHQQGGPYFHLIISEMLSKNGEEEQGRLLPSV